APAGRGPASRGAPRPGNYPRGAAGRHQRNSAPERSGPFGLEPAGGGCGVVPSAAGAVVLIRVNSMTQTRDWQAMREMSARLLEERTGESVEAWNRRIGEERLGGAAGLRARLGGRGGTAHSRAPPGR